MEKLFLEINQLKENKGYIQKDELLYFMKIQKNRKWTYTKSKSNPTYYASKVYTLKRKCITSPSCTI